MILILRKSYVALFFLFLLFMLGVIFHKPLGRLVFPYDFRHLIEEKVEASRIDPNLIAALIFVESKFNSRAESRKGARGLMQIMPETALWVSAQQGRTLDIEELYKPEVNLEIGIWYFAYLLEEFDGDVVLVLASYNAGRAKVKEWLDSGVWQGKLNDLHSIPYLETRRYIAKVFRGYHIYYYLYS
jgi:soluble lytic murein transglycosylase